MSPVIYRPSRSGPDRDRGGPPRVPIAGPGIPTAATFVEDRTPEGGTPQGGAREPVSTRRPTKQRRRRRILGRQGEPPVTVAEPESTAAPEPTVSPRQRRRRGRGVTMSPPPVGPGDQLGDAAEAPEEVQANPAADADAERMVALGGRVRSTRLRGLRGMTVSVIDETDTVVAETLTGRRGEFVIADLPPGTYRVGARDAVDGDFSEGWYGSVAAAGATALHVDDHTSAPTIDLTLTARVGINADVTVADDQATIDIAVIDRTTGLPAVGEVTVSTEHFRTALPLTDGRTQITVLGSSAADGHPLVARVRIQYPGAEHSAPTSRTLRLR
ncbi:carboxypeptidase-like regulatory domain-containing protein [Aeromicrobium sp. CF3.5]|uniref:carboxypeptidase-like regulatory domain-containing protein n=1 Tax=Aeromicrobium sp. CF3.5 TaxID=3373078 RepID=UPI003EE7B53D